MISTSKKLNIVKVIAIILFLIDYMLIVYISKSDAIPALIAFTIAISGPLLVNHYWKEIVEYLKLDIPIIENEITFRDIHEATTLTILSFSTVGIGWFIAIFYLCKEPLIFSLLDGFLISLPMLSIGLRFNCFNDENRYVDGKEEIGYRPAIYLFINFIICFFGYQSLLFINSIQNGIIVFLICTFCFICIVFPDKINRYLPFDNRTFIGFAIYLGGIFIMFLILMKGYFPPEIMELIRDAN